MTGEPEELVDRHVLGESAGAAAVRLVGLVPAPVVIVVLARSRSDVDRPLLVLVVVVVDKW